MKALKSELAKRIMQAGIRIRPGVPIHFEDKTYWPTLVGRDGKPLAPMKDSPAPTESEVK